MITPSVGRIVWYNPRPDEHCYSPSQVLAAIVTGVIDDHTVNLAVFKGDGSGPYPRQNVPLFDGEGAPTPIGHWMWMPYQKGQAAKTEQLQKAADFARREAMPLA